MKISVNKTKWTSFGMLLALVLGAPAVADDTELLLVTPGNNSNPFNANILLIVDSSGSMSTMESTITPYNGANPYSGDCNTAQLYWTPIGVVPACSAGNDRVIDKTAFVCKKAKRQIDGIGQYQGIMVQYRADNTGSTRWQSIENNNATDPVECQADSGFDGSGSEDYAQAGTDISPYTSDPDRELSWGSAPAADSITVYDGNYLNWRANPVPIDMSRLDIVKVATKIAMDSINSSNIGIMRFNDMDGGAVIQAMTDLDSNRAALATVIDNILPDGRTPLAETLYESALYWLGAEAHYGEMMRLTGTPKNPTDPNALSSAIPQIYDAPKSPVCTKNYNVLLTDGEPVEDFDAQSLAPTLPDFFAKLGRTSCSGTNQGDCLVDIAEYLGIPDLSPGEQGDQTVTTHTIGFTINLPILQATADATADGEYYLADDVESLTLALLQIFNNANERALAFTSPAVAVNAFNRTQNLNDLYMTVFQSKNRAHWPGNLKKFRIVNREITDANTDPAVNPLTGFFFDTADSFWTVNGPDGIDVELGGAANQLPSPSSRNLYTNNGISSDLTNSTNAVSVANALAYSAADLGLTGAAGEPTIDDLINWARGEDVRDIDSNPATTVRNVMGDPLHSQPAAVVYGGSVGNEEVVVFTATNDGYLHAIDGATGVELWSFIPKELLSELALLYFDPNATYKRYGIDGDVVPIVVDRDKNGIIDGTDFVHLVFGMRRGGNSYYALDVTDKYSPILLWNKTYSGFGQSWSRPVIARIDIDDPGLNADQAVVVIGAGYDPVHDTSTFPTTNDNAGAGIYMLDLKSGAELWRAGIDSGADLTLDTSGRAMTRAIATEVKVIDLSGDRLADRMYVSDLGGQIWRFDITNGETPSNLVAGGVIAQLGAEGLSVPTAGDTRRFYSAPDVSVFTDPYIGQRYISISIGSGYRAHPLDNSATDRFYSLRDPAVFNRLSQSDYDSYVIATDSDLVEVSGQLGVAVGTTNRGWKFTLPATQKVLVDSFTFDGSVFFVAFSSEINALDPCEPTVGRNFLYRVSVINGDPVVTNYASLVQNDADAARVTVLQQGGIAPRPAIIFPSPDDPNACVGAQCSPPPILCIGVECEDPGFDPYPVRTLWTQDGIE